MRIMKISKKAINNIVIKRQIKNKLNKFEPIVKLSRPSKPVKSNLTNFLSSSLINISLTIIKQSCLLFPKSNRCKIIFEKALINGEKLAKKSKYSKNKDVSIIEKTLAEKGITIRFKNKMETAAFIQKGLNDIEKAGYNIPKNIFMVPSLTINGAGGAAAIFQNETSSMAPIFFPKNLKALSIKKIKRKNQLGVYSTDNISYYIYHEVGHWLHFQKMPSTQDASKIWQTANKKRIKKEVSQMALKTTDGTEFVAEVFAGLVDGKNYSEYVMNIYKQLKGP